MAEQEFVKMTLRLPTDLMEKIEKEAKQLGISKNSYIVMKLQDKIKK